MKSQIVALLKDLGFLAFSMDFPSISYLILRFSMIYTKMSGCTCCISWSWSRSTTTWSSFQIGTAWLFLWHCLHHGIWRNKCSDWHRMWSKANLSYMCVYIIKRLDKYTEIYGRILICCTFPGGFSVKERYPWLYRLYESIFVYINSWIPTPQLDHNICIHIYIYYFSLGTKKRKLRPIAWIQQQIYNIYLIYIYVICLLIILNHIPDCLTYIHPLRIWIWTPKFFTQSQTPCHWATPTATLEDSPLPPPPPMAVRQGPAPRWAVATRPIGLARRLSEDPTDAK